MYKILKQVQSQNLGQTEFMECSVVMKFTFFSLRLLSDQKFDCMELRGTYYLEFTKRV